MSKKHYRYGLLSPDRTKEAEIHNAKLLGPTTLGFEVTIPDLAKRCGLGNIDPQHSAKGTSSAIQQALIMPLPPKSAMLVTIREDADSIGAMAVLTWRLRGHVHKLHMPLIDWIGVTDLEGRARATENHPELADFFRHSRLLDAINAVAHDDILPLDRKVERVGYLLCGGMRREARRAADRVVRPIPGVDYSKLAIRYGPIGYIETSGDASSARRYGEKAFPITVVRDLESGRFSILGWPEQFDREALGIRLNELEAEARSMSLEDLVGEGLAWGGNPTLIVSPTGIGRETQLSPEQVLKVVYESACTNV